MTEKLNTGVQEALLFSAKDHYINLFNLLVSVHEYIADQVNKADEAVILQDPELIKKRYVDILEDIDSKLEQIARGCTEKAKEMHEQSFASISFFEAGDNTDIEGEVGVQALFSNDVFDESKTSHKIIKQIYENMTNPPEEK